ncbi:hypothetical protein [Ferrovibrio terrae]|uniref:hypothetical protein n=1 Tax=Ferrovibrio terrae TaxID=2594003 RepID=UPI003137763B
MAAGHRLALGLLLGVTLVWLLLLGWTIRQAVLPPEASGRVIAVYPFGWDGTASLAAALGTEARLVRQTWLGNALELASDDPGFAARLRQNGAIAVFRAQPLTLFTLAGCTGMPPQSFFRARLG